MYREGMAGAKIVQTARGGDQAVTRSLGCTGPIAASRTPLPSFGRAAGTSTSRCRHCAPTGDAVTGGVQDRDHRRAGARRGTPRRARRKRGVTAGCRLRDTGGGWTRPAAKHHAQDREEARPRGDTRAKRDAASRQQAELTQAMSKRKPLPRPGKAAQSAADCGAERNPRQPASAHRTEKDRANSPSAPANAITARTHSQKCAPSRRHPSARTGLNSSRPQANWPTNASGWAKWQQQLRRSCKSARRRPPRPPTPLAEVAVAARYSVKLDESRAARVRHDRQRKRPDNQTSRVHQLVVEALGAKPTSAEELLTNCLNLLPELEENSGSDTATSGISRRLLCRVPPRQRGEEVTMRVADEVNIAPHRHQQTLGRGRAPRVEIRTRPAACFSETRRRGRLTIRGRRAGRGHPPARHLSGTSPTATHCCAGTARPRVRAIADAEEEAGERPIPEAWSAGHARWTPLCLRDRDNPGTIGLMLSNGASRPVPGARQRGQ